MTNGNDEGWGASGSGGSDWDEWNSPPDPETSEFDRIAWSDTQAGPPAGSGAGWYGADSRRHWNHPTEAPPRKKWRPVALGVAMGVVVLLVVGLVGVFLVGRGDGQQTVEAASTSVPSTAGWSTSAAPTSTEPVEQVTPAAGRSAGSTCNRADIARDIGWGPVGHLDCYGEWAMVNWTQGSGDGGVVRLVDGKWTGTNYGPSSCAPESARAILPAAMTSKYRMFCSSSRSSTRSSRPSTTWRRTTTRPSPRQERRAEPPPAVPEVPAAPVPPPPPPPPPVNPEPTPSDIATSPSAPTSEPSSTQAQPSPSAAANSESEEG